MGVTTDVGSNGRIGRSRTHSVDFLRDLGAEQHVSTETKSRTIARALNFYWSSMWVMSALRTRFKARLCGQKIFVVKANKTDFTGCHRFEPRAEHRHGGGPDHEHDQLAPRVSSRARHQLSAPDMPAQLYCRERLQRTFCRVSASIVWDVCYAFHDRVSRRLYLFV